MLQQRFQNLVYRIFTTFHSQEKHEGKNMNWGRLGLF